LFVAPAEAAGAPELEAEDAADEAAEALLDEAEVPADEPDDAGFEVVAAALPLPVPVVLAVVDSPVVLAGEVVALALPEVAAVAEEESLIVVRTPPTKAPGAEAAATSAAAFA
jgi:hypothetical protein